MYHPGYGDLFIFIEFLLFDKCDILVPVCGIMIGYDILKKKNRFTWNANLYSVIRSTMC